MSASRNIGAVVIGGDFNGLGTVRSLGQAGVPVCVVDDEYSISRFSQFTRHVVRVKDLRDEHRIIEGLLEVGKRLDLRGWVLYPTREEVVVAISRHKAALEQYFRVPTPSWETIQWVWDKRKTYRMARQLGIPVPRAWTAADVKHGLPPDMRLPVAIKPAIKEHFIYATKAKAWRASTPEELQQRLEQAAAVLPEEEILVQDLIPGDGRQQFAYCAFFKTGRAIGTMIARRRRQHPPEFGRASTFVETLEVPLLETLSQSFLQAINYYGLVEVEYKLDPRDGEYKLLDVNARTWGYHSLGQQAGVDFSLMLFADQLGLPVEPCRSRSGVSWIRFITDAPTAVLEMLQGRLSCKEYLHSVCNFQTEAVFCRADPLPALAELALIPYLYVKRGL